ncbi:MAG: hypothetical protein N5P05_004179 (plasmid) [Chroococcopsis gigantea SAG 12.99]|jgi:DNA-binding PadR family transcriptional regulator|nr:hypothetical protein [Chroococcopsis gigantea SAG 12.99]
MFRRRKAQFSTPAPVGFSLGEMPIGYVFLQAKRGCGNKYDRGRFDFGGEEETRTRRGDIKFLLLDLLSEGPAHGYDLIKRMESRYGGFRRLSPGSVYPTLSLLEDGGFVTSETSEGKRVYSLTEAGRQLLSERNPREGDESSRNLRTERSQEFRDLQQAAADLGAAINQVAREGNSERINRVRDLLERTKREIYAILAQE